MKRQDKPAPEREAYTINEFCKAYRVSRTELYRMWERNEGPNRTRTGQRKYVITVEDAVAWRRRPDLKVRAGAAATA